MNEKTTQQLRQEFPFIFSDTFEFECSEGWFDLIRSAALEIQQIVISSKLALDTVTASQVKEKFGELRFYIDFNHSVSEEDRQRIYQAIQNAEQRSSQCCEVCGKPGKIQGRNWVRTLCDEHAVP